MVKSKLQFRTAIVSDYPIISKYDEFLGDRRLDMQQNSLLVADCGELSAIAFLKISPNACFGWPLLEILMVKPSEQRAGVGSEFVKHLIDKSSYLKLFVSTESSNEGMQRLLAKVGAEEVGFIDRLNFNGEREKIYRLV